MNIRKRIGIASILVGCCAAIGAVVVPGHVTAGDDEQQVSLHNGPYDAPVKSDGGGDCLNDAEGDYWHFIISPNDDTFSFAQIHLVIDDSGYDFYLANPPGGIIKNGSQTDNVFVKVPTGKSIYDLEKTGSYAIITPDTEDAPQFNLSHSCDGTDGGGTPTTDDPTETTDDPTETTDNSTSTTDEGGEESGGPTTTDSESGGGIPGAGADNGTLAMLAAFLLIGGGTLVLTSRRRPTETLS